MSPPDRTGRPSGASTARGGFPVVVDRPAPSRTRPSETARQTRPAVGRRPPGHQASGSARSGPQSDQPRNAPRNDQPRTGAPIGRRSGGTRIDEARTDRPHTGGPRQSERSARLGSVALRPPIGAGKPFARTGETGRKVASPRVGGEPEEDASRSAFQQHPRIRQRRIEVTREEGRRRLRRLAASVAAVSVVGTAVAVVYSPVLGIKHLRIDGAQRTPLDTVTDAAGLDLGDPLVSIDAGRVAARVSALPWVASTTVTVSWPTTVRIAVRERVAVATVPSSSACGTTSCRAVVDASGRVLAVVSTTDPLAVGLLPVDGAGGGPESSGPGSTVPPGFEPAFAVAVAMPASLRPSVSAVEITPEGLRLWIAPRPGKASDDGPGANHEALGSRAGAGPVVLLGSGARVNDELTAAATVLAQVPMDGVRVIDVRVPHAPVVTR